MLFPRTLQWKLNDSYLLSRIKMSQPRSKVSFFERPQSRQKYRSKVDGGKSRNLLSTCFFLLSSFGCLSLLLVWQGGNVEGLTRVILQCYTSVHVQALCVCGWSWDCLQAGHTVPLCYFFTIILVITMLYFSLLSESISLMVFLADLAFLCAAAVFMHTASFPVPPSVPPFL